MADPKTKRLLREVSDIQKDPRSGVKVTVLSDDLSRLEGSFPGPEGTPYEGGLFKVSIEVPQKYPFEPLAIRFITKIYHPNVSSASGFICLDVLKSAWSPVLTLRTCLLSIQTLLTTPEPNDPQDAAVASHYLGDRQGFEQTARYWTEAYAMPEDAKGTSSRTTAANGTVSDERRQAQLAGIEWSHVNQFAEMGFDKAKVIDVLSRLNYRGDNVSKVSDDQVVEKLFS